MRLSASERSLSLAGVWLAIYLASHHPSRSAGAEPIEWRPRGIVQLMMTWEDPLVIVQSNCFEQRHIGQQWYGVTTCSCWHVTGESCVCCLALGEPSVCRLTGVPANNL